MKEYSKSYENISAQFRNVICGFSRKIILSQVSREMSWFHEGTFYSISSFEFKSIELFPLNGLQHNLHLNLLLLLLLGFISSLKVFYLKMYNFCLDVR